jgi:hypothetical protein
MGIPAAASHAARNAALASSRLSGAPPFGAMHCARTRDKVEALAAAPVARQTGRVA